MIGPTAAYRQLLDRGALSPDPCQGAAVEKLESLSRALQGYRPLTGRSGWLERLGLFWGQSPRLEWWPNGGVPAESRQGLYLYGAVGRGKSTLMDLFFSAAPVEAKRRVHFHEFMQDVHARLFRLRQEKANGADDPIVHVARDIAAEAHLLCFDELLVTDIGDAMILGRLFESLFDRGVVVVTTSNRAPRDLYKNGLKRDRFLPFIDLIERRLDVLELASERDYRRGRKTGMRVYLTPLGPEAEAGLRHCFDTLAGGERPEPDYIHVNGRSWLLSRTARGVAWFSFDELCDTARGVADYLALATLYRAVLVSDVPLLTPERRDAAKRFATLVAALYEHKTLFACSAAGAPEELYPVGDGAFEFKSIASRLMEMQSEDYICSSHLT